ncbi:conserved hypothetical protein [Trichinella spiralis]|uniref:hypothetical protein n=1 Tax=Trichinella spiralis TaxID=6334 RepID=UPI0001EFC153|nr:conserved hypothetical protein [Trichinella spiralis]
MPHLENNLNSHRRGYLGVNEIICSSIACFSSFLFTFHLSKMNSEQTISEFEARLNIIHNVIIEYVSIARVVNVMLISSALFNHQAVASSITSYVLFYIDI